MDESNYDQYEAGNYEQADYYSAPSGESTKDLNTEFEAPKDGTFYFVVDNTLAGEATPGGESVDVHLTIEETGGLLGLVLIGVIVVVVIGVVVWYFKFRGKGEAEEATTA